LFTIPPRHHAAGFFAAAADMPLLLRYAATPHCLPFFADVERHAATYDAGHACRAATGPADAVLIFFAEPCRSAPLPAPPFS